MTKRIGFVGSGKMAETIAHNLLKRVTPVTRFCYDKQRLIPNLVASDPLEERRQVFSSMGIKTTTDNSRVLADSDMVFLTVRPEDTLGAIRSMKWRNGDSTQKLIVSFVGGMPATAIEQILGIGAKVVRMMPNHLFSGNDVSCGTYYGTSATPDDVNQVVELLGDSARFFEDEEYLPQSSILAANYLNAHYLRDKTSSFFPDVSLGSMRPSQGFHDKYKLKNIIGKGTYATVYKAVDRITGRKYAVKYLELSKESIDYENVIGEVSALSSFKHPHIVRLHDYYSENDKHYLVLDHLEGGSMQDRIIAHGHIEEPLVRTILRQLLSAISYSHHHGVVHRDIKADNVMLKSRDSLRIKLMDFGLCSQLDANTDKLHTVCGSIGYCCPEMLSGLAYGKAADIWSIGVLAYILIAGNPPFYHQDERVLRRLIKSGQASYNEKHWDNVSTECKDIIRSMLVVDPSRRPSASELLSHSFLL